jgi:hypothetical protein
MIKTGVGGNCLQLEPMRKVEGAGIQHFLSPFSSPFFGVKLLYDYGFNSVWVLPVIPLPEVGIDTCK